MRQYPLDSSLVGFSQAELFATSTSGALDTIGSIATNATLVLIEPIPVPPFEPLDCASRASLTGDCTFLAYSDPIPSQAVYSFEASLRPNVETLDIDQWLCPSYPVCEPLVNGIPPFVDQIHINSEFALAAAEGFWQQLEPFVLPIDRS